MSYTKLQKAHNNTKTITFLTPPCVAGCTIGHKPLPLHMETRSLLMLQFWVLLFVLQRPGDVEFLQVLWPGDVAVHAVFVGAAWTSGARPHILLLLFLLACIRSLLPPCLLLLLQLAQLRLLPLHLQRSSRGRQSVQVSQQHRKGF